MKSFFESGANASPPPAPSPGSSGFPNDGSLSPAVAATTVGAYWFHMITQELLAVIAAAGITPNGTTLNQLLQAMDIRYGASGSVFGVGQSWTDLTLSRSSGTAYTNTSGRTKQIHVIVNANSGVTAIVNGATVASIGAANVTVTLAVVVQPGATYVITAAAGIDNWAEFA